ncbi:MAG TPA: type B 50S ribosomal protein L31 [Candidatus Hydrogenedentes bacterium]|nr:type B 50S ribosomal protein L31 [Candidatus Hydrogenedentota bacterium]
MKKGIHPKNYREVVFMDVGADVKWLTRSTVETTRTIEFEGKEYPLYTLDLSSHSHPFFTGKQKFVDSEGRVERFQKKFGATAKSGE